MAIRRLVTSRRPIPAAGQGSAHFMTRRPVLRTIAPATRLQSGLYCSDANSQSPGHAAAAPALTCPVAPALLPRTMPSPAPAADPIAPLVRLLFRGVYDDLPVNAHYDVITQVPDDYALVYKRGHYVLSVHCDVHGLKLLHVPLNPDDACKALDSRAYLESLVESVRTDPGAYYIWSIEGVHLMRLDTDPEYKPLPKLDQPPPPVI